MPAAPESLVHFGSDAFAGIAGQPNELALLYVERSDPAFSYWTGQVFDATGRLITCDSARTADARSVMADIAFVAVSHDRSFER